jgi:MFS family permease
MPDASIQRSPASLDSSPRGTHGMSGGEPGTTHPNLILGICCLSLLLVGMDVTIVNVALPAIQRDLRATLASLQWIIDAYTLVIASLLMLAGAMADRFGRRRVFQAGLAFLRRDRFCAAWRPASGA